MILSWLNENSSGMSYSSVCGFFPASSIFSTIKLNELINFYVLISQFITFTHNVDAKTQQNDRDSIESTFFHIYKLFLVTASSFYPFKISLNI